MMKIFALNAVTVTALNAGTRSSEISASPDIKNADEFFEAIDACLMDLLNLSDACSLWDESTKCVEIVKSVGKVRGRDGFDSSVIRHVTQCQKAVIDLHRAAEFQETQEKRAADEAAGVIALLSAGPEPDLTGTLQQCQKPLPAGDASGDGSVGVQNHHSGDDRDELLLAHGCTMYKENFDAMSPEDRVVFFAEQYDQRALPADAYDHATKEEVVELFSHLKSIQADLMYWILGGGGDCEPPDEVMGRWFQQEAEALQAFGAAVFGEGGRF